MKKVLLIAIVALSLGSCSKSADNNVTPTQADAKGVLRLGGDRVYIAVVSYRGKTDTLNVAAGTRADGTGASYSFTYQVGEKITVKPLKAVGAIAGYIYKDDKLKSSYESNFSRADLFIPITTILN